MKLKKALAAVGTPDFVEQLRLELNERPDLFDLGRWEGSGSVGDLQVDVLNVDDGDESGVIVVAVLVSYEVEVQCCSGIGDAEQRAQRFVVRLRRSNGEAEVECDDAH